MAAANTHQHHRQHPRREATISEVVVSDTDRWSQISLLFHDNSISLYARIGELFTLLFAQPLEMIVAMRTDQIDLEHEGRVLVAFDAIPIEMSPGLDELIRRYFCKPGTSSIASRDRGWLGEVPTVEIVPSEQREVGNCRRGAVA